MARAAVLNGLTTADVTLLRYVVSGAALLPLCLRRRPFPVGQHGWRRALSLVVLAGAPYTLVVVGGVAFAPALHSSVVTFGLIPIAATAFAYPAFGEHPSFLKVADLALIVTGLVVFGWNLCLPLIRPIGLMPPAAGIRDAVHRRAAPSPLCPDSAAAQSEAWVRLSTAINVSASRC